MLSPDGKQLAVVSKDGSIKLFNTETGKLVYTLEGYYSDSYTVRISFTKSGNKLFSWQPFNVPVLWNLTTGRLEQVYNTDDYQGSQQGCYG